VHLNFEENQEFSAFVNCQLSIVNGKAINKWDYKIWLFGTNYAKLLISETGNGKQATDLGLFLY